MDFLRESDAYDIAVVVDCYRNQHTLRSLIRRFRFSKLEVHDEFNFSLNSKARKGSTLYKATGEIVKATGKEKLHITVFYKRNKLTIVACDKQRDTDYEFDEISMTIKAFKRHFKLGAMK